MRYVTGHRVALRDKPSKSGRILDRLDPGRQLVLIEEQAGWSHVRDQLTQREGWLSSRLISDRAPVSGDDAQEASPKKNTVEPPKLPVLTDAKVIARIISQSISDYPGNCPCPCNRDRAGHKCAQRSAYSKPGGYSPVCFTSDVTRGMIEKFRNAAR